MTMAYERCALGTRDLPMFFGDEHAELAARARTFALDTLGPGEDRLSAGGPLSEQALGERCKSIAWELGKLGFLQAVVPPENGGLSHARPGELDVRSVCLIRENLAWGSALGEFVFALQGLGSYPIVRAGTEAQRAEFLPAVLEGRALAAFAITEAEAGSDVGSMKTHARRVGDEYVLNGEKTFISNAGIAAHYVVFATTDPSRGGRGVSAFVVRPDDAGFEFAGSIPLVADHPLGTLRFHDLRLSEARRLGAEGDGIRLALGTLDVFRSTVAAGAVGLARRAMDEALLRANTRMQFGKAIGEFQSVQVYLADMATELDAARLLVYRAAYLKDHGADRVTLEAAMAKLFATEAAQRIIDRALQIHGGAGVVRGNVVERLYREIRAMRIYEGTSEIQRLVIAGAVLGAERRSRSAAS